jgi:hypothetical protein
MTAERVGSCCGLFRGLGVETNGGSPTARDRGRGSVGRILPSCDLIAINCSRVTIVLKSMTAVLKQENSHRPVRDLGDSR